MSSEHPVGAAVTGPGAGTGAAEETVEHVVRRELLTALGGWRGTVESAVPIVAFLVAWSTTKQLNLSLVASGAVMAVLVVVRLVQRQTVQHVLAGALGLGIAAALAVRTGEAGDVFLPGILYNAALAVVFSVSMVLRWPVVGFMFGAVTGDPTGWRERPEVVRLFQKLTGVLLANYVIRVAVQLPLYLSGSVVLLGVSKIALGWPLLGVSVLAIGALLAAGRTPLHAPPPPQQEEGQRP